MLVNKELEQRLNRFRDVTIRSIKDGRTDLALKRIESYSDFASEFVHELTRLNISYTIEGARGATSLEWPFLSRLQNDIWYINKAGIESENADVFSKTLGGLFRILFQCYELNDHLVFRNIINLYPSLFKAASKSISPSFKDSSQEQLWQYLRNFTKYRVIPYQLQKKEKQPGLNELKDYLLLIIRAFAELSKIAIDSGDSSLLEALIEAQTDVLSPLRRDTNLKVITNELIQSTHINIFGLGAWIVKEFSENYGKAKPAESNPLASLVDVISKYFSSLQLLSNTYVNAINQNLINSIWENWIFEDMPEGKVSSFNFSKWLNAFFCFQGINLIHSGIEACASDIPINRTIKENLLELETIIKQIESQQPPWQYLIKLQDSNKEKPRYFIECMQLVVSKYDTILEDQIINSQISQNKVEEFIKLAVNSYNQNAWLDRIITDLGTIEVIPYSKEPPVPNPDYFRMGPTLYPKDMFIDIPEINYVGFGVNEGRQIALDKSSLILKQWFENAEILRQDCRLSDLIDDITSKQVLIRLEGYIANAIFIQGRYTQILRELSNTKVFKPYWVTSSAFSNLNGFLGTINSLPVIQVPGKEETALVIDLKSFGTLRSYEVSEKPPKLLTFSVDSIDELKAKEFISKGLNKTVRELLLSVVFTIQEKFSYDIIHPEAAKLLIIKA